MRNLIIGVGLLALAGAAVAQVTPAPLTVPPVDPAAAQRAADAEKAAAASPTGDARDVATQVCLSEAKSRAMAVGATNLAMNEVKDTDVKNDGRAAVTAKVNVTTTDSKGKIKTHQVGKRHRLINNSPARTRDLRGMDLLSKSESQRVKRWMPYGGGI